METKAVHIVSFDIPYPANYGGVIDVFYKIKALYKLGVEIHLHCFEYGRNHSEELLSYCKTVTYYHRNISSKLLLSGKPYIVESRFNAQLVKNLNVNDYPIVLEGLHTSHIFEDDNWIHRNIIVRTHNVEHEYYKQLAKVEKNVFKKYYFLSESSKLLQYESILKHANGIASISESDRSYFQQYNLNTKLVHAFHGNDTITTELGKGDYILYHGNLSVAENHETAMYILKNIAPYTTLPFYIAGSKPRSELKELALNTANVKLFSTISNEKMQNLLKNAHIHFLVTNQSTGVKLKLLNSLFQGRHCVVNNEMIYNSLLGDACEIVNSSNYENVISTLNNLSSVNFDEDRLAKRKVQLQDYNDASAAKILYSMLFESVY